MYKYIYKQRLKKCQKDQIEMLKVTKIFPQFSDADVSFLEYPSILNIARQNPLNKSNPINKQLTNCTFYIFYSLFEVIEEI